MRKMCGAVRTTSFVVGVLLLVIATLDAAPSPSMPPNFYSELADEGPQQQLEILEMLARLGQNMIRDDLENAKRSRRTLLDFGTRRGDSGRIEANHRLGIDMAQDPQGPGKNSKRGLGFGMDRGFSGQQAAKHLMGLHAATWAGGPGRRRRSESEEAKRNKMDLGLSRGYSGEQTARYLLGAQLASQIGKREPSGEPEE